MAVLIDRYGLRDKWLLLALLLGLALGVQGFTWGRYSCLNPDQMAFRGIFPKHGPAFQPSDYLKPPFYTYLNHFIARVPADRITGTFMFWMSPHERFGLNRRMRVSFARTLNLVMFALSTMGIYVLARHYFSIGGARMASLFFATSAGLVPYQIFLTSDLAVTFMMLAAFLFSVRILDNPGMHNSIAAGLLTGLAAATKYNGILVAVCLPLAHLLADTHGNALANAIKRKSAWVCGLAVPLGFLLGNPYAVLDWTRFRTDFLYNYVTTPVYHGGTTGNSYVRFWAAFVEIFGMPAMLLLAIAIPLGVVWVIYHGKVNKSWKPWLMAASICLVYFQQIGSFPRLETRFVLPLAPFMMILGSAGFVALLKFRLLIVPAATLVVIYNIACGWYVGQLFRCDPRNYIPQFAREHLWRGGTVEWSRSLPKLDGLPEKLTIYTIYTGLAQAEMFQTMFTDNPEIASEVARKETSVRAEWFSKSSRELRNPDYIMWCSIDLDALTLPEYNALYSESSGYRVVYDANSVELPTWAYPQRTEFLHQRTTIWERITVVVPSHN